MSKSIVFFTFLCFLLIAQGITYGNLITVQNENLQKQSVTNCILTILNQGYATKLVSGTIATLLEKRSEKHTEVLLFRKLFKEYKWTALNLRSRHDNMEILATKEDINTYLIKILGMEDINKDIHRLKTNKYWNPQAKLIIYAEKYLDYDKDINSYVFMTLMKQGAINSILLLPQEKNNTIYNIYTWYPYHNGNCGDYEDVFLIDVCHNGTLKLNHSIFPEKVPRKLAGCPVKVRTVIWPPYVIAPKNYDLTDRINFTSGLEIELLNTVAKAANFTPVYSVSSKIEDWGLILENGTSTGLFESLLNEEVDLGIGTLAATTNRFMFFQPSVPYGTESLTWCVPSAALKPTWLNIFSVYKMSTYVIIFGTFLITSFTTYFISKFIDDIHAYNDLGNNFINMYAAFLGLSLKLKPHFSSSRLVFFMCAFLNLIIGAVFQTTLISYLANPMYEKQITTLEEIFHSNLEILYMDQTRKYYSWDVDDWRMQKVLNEMIECKNAYDCINDIAKKRNASIAIPRLFLLYTLDKLTTKDGRLLVHWFKEDMISFPVHIYMTKGFPFAKTIDTYIYQSVQTGIMDKFQSDLQTKLNMKNKNINAKSSESNFQLKLEQLYGAFLILFIGFVISTLTFIAELIIYKRNKKRKIIFIH